MPNNFLAYKAANLRKINSQRRALSQPTIEFVPTLTKGQLLYVPESVMDGEPATCYNCVFYNVSRSCQRMGPKIRIRKFVYPQASTEDAKQIEYWPCCGGWDKGDPNYGKETFISDNSPDTMGLGWINAPDVGLKYSGATCGGANDGDDCDHYITDGDGDKRDYPAAFCRVLQQPVENGAVCAVWMDDDWLSYDRAVNLMRELDNERGD